MMAFPIAHMQKFSKNYFSALNEQIWAKISTNSQKSMQNLKKKLI